MDYFKAYTQRVLCLRPWSQLESGHTGRGSFKVDPLNLQAYFQANPPVNCQIHQVILQADRQMNPREDLEGGSHLG
jgi:hypothetical protein